MKRSQDCYLSKREQQIMEIVYRDERITANELTALLPGAPSNSTVRTLLRILEEKGELRHIEEAGHFVYLPAHARQSAAKSALKGVIDTFFQGSAGDLMAALLTEKDQVLTDAEVERLTKLIADARKEGR